MAGCKNLSCFTATHESTYPSRTLDLSGLPADRATAPGIRSERRRRTSEHRVSGDELSEAREVEGRRKKPTEEEGEEGGWLGDAQNNALGYVNGLEEEG